MKEQSRREYLQRIEALRYQIRTNAESRKHEKVMNEARMKKESEEVVLSAKEKCSNVRFEEQRIKANLERFRQLKESSSKGLKDARVETEKARIEEADKMLKILEKKEQSILS